MKKKEIEKLRKKSVVELEKEVKKAKLQARADKAAISAGSEKNLKKAYLARKDISVMLTLISEKMSEEKNKKANK